CSQSRLRQVNLYSLQPSGGLQESRFSVGLEDSAHPTRLQNNKTYRGDSMSDSAPSDDAFGEGRPRPRRPQPERRGEPPPLPDEYDERPRRPTRRRRERDYEDDDTLSTIIPYHNGRALAAYYTGVFSFICVIGVPLAIVAIILGILGLNY